MPEFNANLDDEVLTDGSVPIAGVNNAQPPSTIGATLAEEAVNRLAEPDGLNRPRPGLRQRVKTPVSFDSIHHVGNGKFIWNDATTGSSTIPKRSPVYRHREDRHGRMVTRYTAPFAIRFSIFLVADCSTNTPRQPMPTLNTSLPRPSTRSPNIRFGPLPGWSSRWPTISMSGNILSPEVWNPVLQSVTLDPVASDEITGQVVWQRQTLAVFRNGSTWIIETGPNLDVVDWEINRASATVGCCSHGTMSNAGGRVFSLGNRARRLCSFSGADLRSDGRLATDLGTDQTVHRPDQLGTSRSGPGDLRKDLYILSVPIDDSPFNNAIFAYSVTLNAWQGVWTYDFDQDGVGYGFRDSARDRTNPNATLLLYGTIDGWISEQSYPTDRQYWELATNNTTRIPMKSKIRTRSFTFSETINQIQPHTARIQFLESNDPVDVTVITDRTIKLRKVNTPTGQQGLSIPIPGFTFSLTEQGYYNLPMSLNNIGVCSEIQLELEAPGNWSLYQLKLTAFEAAPLTVR